jgi:hypothetical protein
MSTHLAKYRKIIRTISEVRSLTSASEILEAYHKLQELGSNELDTLRFEYVTTGIENPFLEKVFEYHLPHCFDCLQITVNYKHLINATDLYGDRVIKNFLPSKLSQESARYQEKGNIAQDFKSPEAAHQTYEEPSKEPFTPKETQTPHLNEQLLVITLAGCVKESVSSLNFDLAQILGNANVELTEARSITGSKEYNFILFNVDSASIPQVADLIAQWAQVNTPTSLRLCNTELVDFSNTRIRKAIRRLYNI